MNRGRETPFVPVLLYMMAGFLIWAAYFLATYGAVGIGCARELGSANLLGMPLLPLVVGGATVLALIAAAAVLFAALRRRRAGTRSFVESMAITLSLLAMVAIAWNGIPALLLHDCS